MRRTFFLTGLVILALASMSLADVIVNTYTEIDMIGAGKMAIRQEQFIKGDRSYDESTTKMFGPMAAQTDGKRMKNIQIVRLDKNIGWSLNPDAKSYTEFSFEQMRANFAQTKQHKAMGPMDQYEWKTEFTKGLKDKKILDFNCKGIRAISIGVNKNDSKDSIFITNEQWFSVEPPGGDEFIDFTEKMAVFIGSKKGFLNQMSMNPILARFGDQLGEMAKEFESFEGVPLKTTLIVEGTINPMEEAMAGKELDEEAKAMMKKMGMALPGETPEGGHHNFISLSSKVTSIEEKPIENSRYEIPEGYKKQ